jgi:hypothetical protein
MCSERKSAEGIPFAFKFRLSSQLGDAQAIVPHKSRGPKFTGTASSHEGIQFPPDKRSRQNPASQFLDACHRFTICGCGMHDEIRGGSASQTGQRPV